MIFNNGKTFKVASMVIKNVVSSQEVKKVKGGLMSLRFERLVYLALYTIMMIC